MSVARANLPTATTLLDGRVLVAGGFNGSRSGITSAEIYNPNTGQWSITGSMSTGRYYATAALLSSGQVLAAGGLDSSAELYDPGTGFLGTRGKHVGDSKSRYSNSFG